MKQYGPSSPGVAECLYPIKATQHTSERGGGAWKEKAEEKEWKKVEEEEEEGEGEDEKEGEAREEKREGRSMQKERKERHSQSKYLVDWKWQKF